MSLLRAVLNYMFCCFCCHGVEEDNDQVAFHHDYNRRQVRQSNFRPTTVYGSVRIDDNNRSSSSNFRPTTVYGSVRIDDNNRSSSSSSVTNNYHPGYYPQSSRIQSGTITTTLTPKDRKIDTNLSHGFNSTSTSTSRTRTSDNQIQSTSGIRNTPHHPLQSQNYQQHQANLFAKSAQSVQRPDTSNTSQSYQQTNPSTPNNPQSSRIQSGTITTTLTPKDRKIDTNLSHGFNSTSTSTSRTRTSDNQIQSTSGIRNTPHHPLQSQNYQQHQANLFAKSAQSVQRPDTSNTSQSYQQTNPSTRNFRKICHQSTPINRSSTPVVQEDVVTKLRKKWDVEMGCRNAN